MKEFIDIQYKNLFLWTPFLVALGGSLYFSLDNEPGFQFPILITVLLCAIILKNKNIFIRTFALFLFGFFYSMSFTQTIKTPQIQDSFGDVNISGIITDIDFTFESTRLFLNVPINQINPKFPENKNVNIRVSIKDMQISPNIGDTISGKAIIFRPSPKYAPESFDFARWAYFSNLSGIGFFKDYDITSLSNNNSIRNFIHDKSKSILSDTLVLGYKKSISENERKIWQSIGLGHVWSISGFHMALIGGWLFALFYLIFRLIAPITKRIPAKYPSMICAWIWLFFYLCISGINVATIRAFLMTTFIFSAAIIGRGILSLRNAALAFLIIFLINPFYVMTAGFQLSFAAIFGLLWFFKDVKYVKRDLLKHIGHVLYVSLQTTLVATIFTLPFIIAHFGFIPLYALIGNLIVLPIFSFTIMPLVVFGTIFALFNNHSLLNLADYIYRFALDIGQYISDIPYANINMSHISNTVLILLIFGMLCIILIVRPDTKNAFFRNINYVIGGTFIFVAVTIFIITPRPLFFATEDHKLVSFVNNGELQFNKARSSKHYFAFNTWRKFNNETEKDKNKKYNGCTKGLCIYKTSNWNIAYMKDFTTVMENIERICNDKKIDYIVTTFDISPKNCHAKILNDGIMIYPSGHITHFSNHRPWHMLPTQNTDQTVVH
ncbi:MAG: ComEC/Rec2 family competence protein [Alphaproteobacteria bacterium]|nr:ComEC/Rec2 family competence protein [Alphaproteobacteria bacterium]